MLSILDFFFLFECILRHACICFVINHKTGSMGNLHSAASQDREGRSEIDPVQTRKPRTNRSRSAARESWLFADAWLHVDPPYAVNCMIKEIMMMSIHKIRAFLLLLFSCSIKMSWWAFKFIFCILVIFTRTLFMPYVFFVVVFLNHIYSKEALLSIV